ncbi:ankyrin-like protein [Zalerion maritima]|uniref:Ankyrin-like protein n=1 Tax=Zalerion maritima TaxID=339359 RepID=A0AAD5RUR3_9PEZI|nr:ankyrin-like protein [Zalerion maritima]
MSDPAPAASKAPPTGPKTAADLPPEAIAFAARMYNAARCGDIEIFQQALLAGLPASMTNEKGDSLLMLAAYYGHPELVKLLISHGADPNSLNDRCQSPIAGAVFKKEDAVVDVLLEGGADPDYGAPSAMQCIGMFQQDEKWKAKFEAAKGRGKAIAAEGEKAGQRVES